jgi:hypothetical protein
MTIDARTPTAPIAPVVKSVEVACAPDRAFELFTSGIGQWWPLLTHSVYGEEAASVVMGAGIGTEIVETSAAGQRSSWGTIVAWEPGRSVAFTWHPGLPVEETTDVVVRFTPTARGTLVELVHTGWERWEDPGSKRDNYDAGWVSVMARFADRASAPEPE